MLLVVIVLLLYWICSIWPLPLWEGYDKYRRICIWIGRYPWFDLKVFALVAFLNFIIWFLSNWLLRNITTFFKFGDTIVSSISLVTRETFNGLQNYGLSHFFQVHRLHWTTFFHSHLIVGYPSFCYHLFPVLIYHSKSSWNFLEDNHLQ